ncbi:phytanoyl-CoA dioxygenase family protein [Paludisphaera rhizosphaerae]|uniref:phytanoyl-CoA dioxygenase family protein n=1 Tax=Paludisphaera rhizosphaerae TaxID=2711216 RepID=UPI0013EA303D|nr:phytanoyl-CoA dioxygenase family protein [Paludisphaera rhizosphaerae]
MAGLRTGSAGEARTKLNTDPARRDLGALYQREGFAVVAGLVDTTTATRIRQTIDGFYEQIHDLPPGHVYNLDPESVRAGRPGIPAIRNILRLDPELRRILEPAALGAARSFLGKTAPILWDAAVYMPAGHPEVESPWHQDAAVYGLTGKREPKSYGYFWMALEDVDASGGAIRFVPGSHLGPKLPHHWRRGDENSGMETSAAIDPATVYTASLRAGDATFHHPWLLHGAGPNLSDRCRKAWVLGVGAPNLPPWLHRLRVAFKQRFGR